jgi:hypothetical protein
MDRIPEELQQKQIAYPRSVKRLIKLFDNIKYNSPLYFAIVEFNNENMNNKYSQKRKQEENLTIFQNEENYIYRNIENDRHFPIETIMLQSHNLKHETDLDKAIIHIGMIADEYVRSFHALAITLGNDIFFRNGVYKPETEEGRKIITHELTHVSQNKKKKITPNQDNKILEKEAEASERKQEYDSDPYEPYPVGNEVYYLKRSQIEKVTIMTADKIEKWLEEQKIIRDEIDFLKLLIAYEEFLDEY